MPSMIRQRTVIEIVDGGLSFYRTHFGTIMAIVLLWHAPLYLLKSVLFAADRIELERVFTPFHLLSSDYTAANLITATLDFVVYTLSMITLYDCTNELGHGHDYAARRGVSTALNRFSAVLLASLLIWILTGVGLALCFVPGIYFGVQMLLSTAIQVNEPTVRFDSLWRRSRFLIDSTQWWRVLGCAALVWALLTILGFSLAFLVTTLFDLFLEQLRWLSGEIADERILTMAGGAITSLIVLPLQAVFWTLMYWDLRCRREGLDIQLATERL